MALCLLTHGRTKKQRERSTKGGFQKAHRAPRLFFVFCCHLVSSTKATQASILRALGAVVLGYTSRCPLDGDPERRGSLERELINGRATSRVSRAQIYGGAQALCTLFGDLELSFFFV